MTREQLNIEISLLINKTLYDQNTITYHDISTQRDVDMEYALENCHIKYCYHQIDKKEDLNYLNAYEKIAEEMYNKKQGDSEI